MKPYLVIIPCLLAVLLAACQPGAFSYWKAKPGSVLYEEDFSNPPGDWPEYSTTDASSAFTGGKYILWVSSPFFSSWALTGSEYENIQVEVEAARLGGPQSNMYGLTCRADEGGNFYFFIISSDGYHAIGKMQAGKFSLLGQEMMAFSSVINQDEGTNHLRFDCIDSTLTGYVNDQMVAVTGDDSFTTGYTGVITGSFDSGGVVVSFDNFTVYKP